MREAVGSELGRYFPPEFLNRFDSVLIFNPLPHDVLLKIAAKMLRQLKVRIEATDAALEYLSDWNYDPAMGARPIRRAVQQLVEEPLSDAIIRGEVEHQHGVRLDVEDGHLTFTPLAAEADTAPGHADDPGPADSGTAPDTADGPPPTAEGSES